MNHKKTLPIICILLSCTILFACGQSHDTENNMSVSVMEEETEETAAEEEIEGGQYNWNDADLVLHTEDVLNVLVVGKDMDEENTSRSDSIILASINRKSGQLTMVSLMRDTYVDIPGHGSQKINAAYSYGQEELLKETIELNYETQIDYYVTIDFDAFQVIVDGIGGITLELSEEEAEYLRGYGGNYHKGKVGYYTGGRTYDAVAGENRMYGQMALDYCRARHVGNSDYERTERQRKVIQEIWEEVQGQNIFTLLSTLQTAFPFIKTDFSLLQALSVANTILQMKGETINSYRLPMEGNYTEERNPECGDTIMIQDWDITQSLLRQFLYSNDGGKRAIQIYTDENGTDME